jgi:hypothetical protein
MENHDNLKKTLKGLDGFLFLVNDFNNEIRQHFDHSYKNKFNHNIFIKDLNYKKEFCKKRNIKHFFFIIPDKSLVCKDFLPFDFKEIKRNYDLLSNLIPDFSDDLDHNCYFKNDTHINYIGGKKLSYCYLNHIDKNFSLLDYENLISENLISADSKHDGDLTFDINWSYSDEEKNDYLKEKKVFGSKFLTNLYKDIPELFKYSSSRETRYFKNRKGVTDLKVLIFHDSAINLIYVQLALYFKEILLYWDHWSFNEQVIDWFKPDIIIEIRTERFLENIPLENTPTIRTNKSLE